MFPSSHGDRFYQSRLFLSCCQAGEVEMHLASEHETRVSRHGELAPFLGNLHIARDSGPELQSELVQSPHPGLGL